MPHLFKHIILGVLLCLTPQLWAQEVKHDVTDPTHRPATPAPSISPSTEATGISTDTQRTTTLQPATALPDHQPPTPVTMGRNHDSLRIDSIDFAHSIPLLKVPEGHNYYSAPIDRRGWYMTGAATGIEYPGLMTTQSGYLGMRHDEGPIAIEVGASANHYLFNIMPGAGYGQPMQTQLGISGGLTYHLDEHWSVTAFGQYYNRNPYISMAAFPYVATSSYGGYMTYRSGNFGMKMGAERKYNPFERRWITQPIVTPMVKVGKMTIELPVGPAVGYGLERLVKGRHHQGPMIMPSGW